MRLVRTCCSRARTRCPASRAPPAIHARAQWAAAAADSPCQKATREARAPSSSAALISPRPFLDPPTHQEYTLAIATDAVAVKARIAAVADTYANQGARAGALLPFTSALAGLCVAAAAFIVEINPLLASAFPALGT